MATENKTITGTWSLMVDSTKDFTLSLLGDYDSEWAVSDSAVLPTVSGHILKAGDNEGVNRALTGPGYVFVRLATLGSARVAVTAWLP